MSKQRSPKKKTKALYETAFSKGFTFGQSLQTFTADAEFYVVLLAFARGLVEADDQLRAEMGGSS
jgi:hypothetical protein